LARRGKGRGGAGNGPPALLLIDALRHLLDVLFALVFGVAPSVKEFLELLYSPGAQPAEQLLG
jgi:hypothetical protein